ncbi:MAG: DUF3298 domain-containing protein [Clostridia bacterium]|nr:DUF3298 domain-containing protein [Clostridia bacterium]
MKQKTKIIIFVCIILILIGLIILSGIIPKKNKNTNSVANTSSSPINNSSGGNENNLFVKITYNSTSEVYSFEGTDKTITVYQDFPTVDADDETVKNKIQTELGKIANDEFEAYKNEVQKRIDNKAIDAVYMDYMGNLTLKWTFSNDRNDTKVVSVVNESTGGLGGVSWFAKKGYSFSSETGDRLTIKDIAINEEALKKYINEEIVKYLRKNYQSLGIYPDLIDKLNEKVDIDNMNWYLSGNGITVCFESDSVSPDTFDYTIKYDELDGLVKSEYLK